MTNEARSVEVDVDGLRVHAYVTEPREEPTGPPVLLVHGWPTSGSLWRNVAPPLAARRRVIAIDLPGFGRSGKPRDVRYDFGLFERCISGLLAAQGVDRVGLVVHDLGGPVGLHWAAQQPADRIERLALLNTLVYPELSLAVRAFLLAPRLPLAGGLMTSPWGLKKALEYGVGDRRRLRPDAVSGIQAPFADPADRHALMASILDLDVSGLEQVAAWVRGYRGPVRVIYGARDRYLPDVARTMRRVAADLPQTEVTVLEDCGHFLQEDRPEEVGRLLAAFFA